MRSWIAGWMLGAMGAMAAMAAMAQPVAQPVADTLAQRLQACTPCHGDQGRSTPQGYFPRIAGKPAGYLFHQLRHFRDGQRQHGAMTGLVQFLTDDYLHEMAWHFAALNPPHAAMPPVALTALQSQRGRQLAIEGDTARGLPACAACHGEALGGMLPATPGLRGLPRDYLSAQLGAWRAGARRAMAPDCMALVARRLDAGDMEAVARWLAALPPEAAVAPRAPGPLPLACGSTGP